ncbi:MAG: hypothetical protein GXP27_12575, partial [Planctomycetes bacterium]|nr:hypothetical protein [Planctomycetota bacterium]
ANELVAHVTELIYDGPSRVAVLRSDSAARVTHRTSILVCPEITVTHDEQGKIVSAWCRGAGRLEHRDRRNDRLILDAGWLTQMRLYPDPNSNWNLIEMQDQAHVAKADQQMALKADLIRLWYEPAERNRSKPTSADSDGGPKGLRKNRPHYLIASGHVEITSPQLEGQTERLEVSFARSEPTDSAAQTDSTGRASKSLPNRTARPAGAAKDGPLAEGVSPLLPVPNGGSRQQPVQIEAQTIKVRLREGSDAEEYGRSLERR